MSFNFNELNLSDSDVSTGAQILKPGKYVVKIKDVKVGEAKKRDGSMVMSLRVDDVNGAGGINHWINLLVKSSKQATDIGRGELKTLLHFGGHPNPDKPGDVSSLNGLTVGVIVKASSYVKNGETREGSEIAAFIDPADVDPSLTPRPAPVVKPAELDDSIPF